MPHRRLARCFVLAAMTIAAGVSPARASEGQRASAPPPPTSTTINLVPPPPQSQLEALVGAPDTLLVQDLYRVGDASTVALGIAVDAVVVTESGGTARHLRGLRVDITAEKGGVSYVDFEELPALSQALEQMVALGAQWTGRGDARATEITFKTVGGLSVALHQDARGQRGTITSGFTPPAEKAIALADLTTLRNAIDQAIELLRDK